VKATLAIRPIAPLPDRDTAAVGASLRVAGRAHRPFAAAEVIARDAGGTRRRLVSAAALRADPEPRLAELIARIESPRAAIAGLSFDRPRIMGILNVTPDSFSDGGQYFDSAVAVEHALRLEAEGADIIDIGGESTRPGAGPVSADEELRRVVPVLERLEAQVPVSIDTSKAEVASRALELGAELVNDVTALRGDPGLAGVVAEHGAYLCLMHMLGEPRTMQRDPRYDDVVADVKRFLQERLAAAVEAGIAEDRICLDPGIGFGKTVEHNFELVRRLDELAALGRPILVGFSRKSSLGKLLGDPEATTGTTAASVGAAVAAYERGATILRVHDVRDHVEALTAAAAVLG
jgi:dihydropteroate synthase